jgi:thiosulfate/3-mercaptopyruvate sulfurtransferase
MEAAGMTLPDMHVDADWVQAHLDEKGIVPVEADDSEAYDKGHIKGAVKLDWKHDLQDPVTHGFIDRARFEALLSERGIANDDTVILYGGSNNWFAAWAWWYFKVYGHRSVRLLDGGREGWELASREMVTDVPRRPATVYRTRKQERWIRVLIRARTQGTWPPARPRWSRQAAGRRSTAGSPPNARLQPAQD